MANRGKFCLEQRHSKRKLMNELSYFNKRKPQDISELKQLHHFAKYLLDSKLSSSNANTVWTTIISQMIVPTESAVFVEGKAIFQQTCKKLGTLRSQVNHQGSRSEEVNSTIPYQQTSGQFNGQIRCKMHTCLLKPLHK